MVLLCAIRSCMYVAPRIIVRNFFVHGVLERLVPESPPSPHATDPCGGTVDIAPQGVIVIDDSRLLTTSPYTG